MVSVVAENSQLANARFQAAGAIRDAAIREWGTLSDEDKKGLILYAVTWNFSLFITMHT